MSAEYREPTAWERAYPPGSFPWLTVELALYAVLAMVALVARLAALGRFPLSAPEADTALAAWRAVQGGDWRPEAYSPLLFGANLLLFALTRAGDGAARLLPAVAGASLVALPYAVRRTVGRGAALLMAVLLALSPGWVFFSRTNDWPIVAAALAAGLLAAIDRYRQTGLATDARLVAAALALGLLAGPGIVTPIVAVAAYAVLWSRRATILERARLHGLALGAASREGLLLAGGVLVALGSTLWVDPGGIGAAANLVWRWFAALAPDPAGPAWTALPVMLLTYESLTVGLAAVGAVAGLRRRDPLDRFLAGWAALALILGTLLGQRGPEWLLNALLPLVALAGRGGAYLWGALRGGVTWADAVALAAALALGAFAFFEIAAYLHTTQQPFLIYGLLVVATLVLAWVGFWIWGQPLQAARVGATVLVLLALVFTARATTALAYQTARDPREPLVGRAALPDGRDMEALLRRLSSRMAGDPRALDVAYQLDLDPWLGWYLRDYAAARSVAGLGRGPLQGPLGATPVSLGPAVLVLKASEADPGPPGYVGQRFILSETWPGQFLSAREYLRWFLYRAPVGEVERSYLQVWVQAPGIVPPTLQRTNSTP